MLALAGIAVGGALGSVGRYWFALWAGPVSRRLPLGTIGLNVLGSFLISLVGFLVIPAAGSPIPAPVLAQVRLAVMVGFCGGFTTFSSFSLQTFDLLRGGAWIRAWLNVILSVVLCLAAIALGQQAATHLWSLRP